MATVITSTEYGSALEAFYEAAVKLDRVWQEVEVPNYPFAHSFDEVVAQIYDWKNSVQTAQTLAAFEVGKRVRLRRSIDRYPHFLAAEGLTGVVNVNNQLGGLLSVKMDQPLKGAEEWDNCIIWQEDISSSSVVDDLELFTEPEPESPLHVKGEADTAIAYFKVCDRCGRKTWSPDEVNCNLVTGPGTRCTGTLVRPTVRVR